MDIKIIKEYKYTGGDEISHYNARFKNNPTPEEFVEWVLKEYPYEYGYIRSYEDSSEYVEYRDGEIRKLCDNYSEIKDKTISLGWMYGGWSRMDYCINFV